jgi:hypothetical protein
MRRPFNRMIDAGVWFGCSQENAIFGANMLTARRRSKNSGGGIAPAAIEGLIKGVLYSVNAFRASAGPAGGPGKCR